MPVAFLLRRLLLITILVLPQSFWMMRGWRLAARPRRRLLCYTGRAFLIASVVTMCAVLVDNISFRFLPAAVSARVAPGILLWVFSSTLVYLLIMVFKAIAWSSTALAKLFAPSAHDSPPDPRRRLLLQRTFYILAGMPFVAAVYGFALERLRFRVVRVEIPVANLPPALDGLRVVQISDIHAGDYMPMHEVRRAVQMANRLDPQLTVITGDFISRAGNPLAECVRELSGLRAQLGVWGCNGNHEIYADAEQEAENLFRHYGMTLLRQSAAQLRWNGAPFNLIGVDYQKELPFTGSAVPSLDSIAHLVRRDMPNVLLSHNPNTFPSAAAQGIELSLAGHTHGGQVSLNFVSKNLNPARFMTRFIAGPYHLPMGSQAKIGVDETYPLARLYVNRGLGTLGVPARIGADPEITLLTLRSMA